jgi:hypothetical protein
LAVCFATFSSRRAGDRWFPPDATLVPTVALSKHVVARCSEYGISGGAVYDALVGLSAAEAKLTLVTRDERASQTYRLLGIPFDVMSRAR